MAGGVPKWVKAIELERCGGCVLSSLKLQVVVTGRDQIRRRLVHWEDVFYVHNTLSRT